MLRSVFLLTCVTLFSCAKAQDVYALSEIDSDSDLPVKVQPLQSDSLASSFLIWIAAEVKAHFHASHTEYVYVLEGTGKMVLADSLYDVKPGDLIYIPSHTTHSVQVASASKMKVLSVQAPEFQGKDRIFLRRPDQK